MKVEHINIPNKYRNENLNNKCTTHVYITIEDMITMITANANKIIPTSRPHMVSPKYGKCNA